MPSPDRVWKAVDLLTPADLIRLRRYARWRIRWLGRKALGRDERDLLDEAIISTVTGKRVWAEDVSLLVHLLGAVRSISSSWHQKRGEEYLESELTRPGEVSPFAGILTGDDPETLLMQKERAEQVTRLFEQDEIASEVIELLADGFSAKEIRARVGLTQAEYSAVTKRIRRKAERELGLRAGVRPKSASGVQHSTKDRWRAPVFANLAACLTPRRRHAIC